MNKQLLELNVKGKICLTLIMSKNPMKRYFSKFENLIWVIALLTGFIYIVVVPPFQVPDSPNHFFRTYQLATGQLSPLQKNNSVGGYVPKSFHQFQETFTPYRYNPYHKMEKSVLTETRFIPLNESDKVFMHFPNTAVYSPISYIPQVISMRIGLWMDFGPHSIFYLVKIVSFLTWMAMMRVVFYFLPIKKKLFAVLLLLPMSLFINSSFSADMMINGLSWVYMAIILNSALVKQVMSTRRIILLVCLIALIGLAKLVYIPIVLLLLLIPAISFGGKLKMGFVIFISIFIGFGSASIWKNHIDTFYTSYINYNIEFRDEVTLGYQADMNLQMDYIKENKLKTMGVFATSYVREFGDMMTGFIGNLGWNRFKMPYWFVFLVYGVLLFFAVGNSGDIYFLSVKQKIILLAVIGGTTILVMLSQYLTWNPVGNDKLWPLMGRYFTPVYPMLFLLFSTKRIALPRWSLAVFFAYGLLATGYTIYKMTDSFYVTKDIQLAWSYDFDKKEVHSLNQEHEFEFGRVNGNSNIVSALDSTNSFWVEFSEENPFGYSVTFQSLTKGDKIEVEGWRTNSSTTFVFDDKPSSDYYTATCHSTKLWDNNFEFIQETYFCKEDFEELKVYLYHTSNEDAFAKGFKIKYYKAK